MKNKKQKKSSICGLLWAQKKTVILLGLTAVLYMYLLIAQLYHKPGTSSSSVEMNKIILKLSRQEMGVIQNTDDTSPLAERTKKASPSIATEKTNHKTVPAESETKQDAKPVTKAPSHPKPNETILDKPVLIKKPEPQPVKSESSKKDKPQDQVQKVKEKSPEKQTPKPDIKKKPLTSSNSTQKPNVKASRQKETPKPGPPRPSIVKNKNETKYLVYLCDDKKRCGGWGDRQRGLTSLYLLSILIDRQFKVIMTSPCNVTMFYAPAKVQWIPGENELNSKSKIILDGFKDEKVMETIAKTDFNSVYPQKVVYIQTNRDYYYSMRHNGYFMKRLKEWNLGSGLTRFRWAWRDLMQPTVRLLAHLEEHVGPQILVRKGLTAKPFQTDIKRNLSNDVGNSTLLCAHVRLGRNPTLPMDDIVSKFNKDDVTFLFDFMISQDFGKSRFFVASDSEEIRAQTQRFFGQDAVAYGGNIMHIDRQRQGNEACTGFEDALVEQLLLSVCDNLVISDSGFSRHAAYTSNKTTIFSMRNGEVSQDFET